MKSFVGKSATLAFLKSFFSNKEGGVKYDDPRVIMFLEASPKIQRRVVSLGVLGAPPNKPNTCLDIRMCAAEREFGMLSNGRQLQFLLCGEDMAERDIEDWHRRRGTTSSSSSSASTGERWRREEADSEKAMFESRKSSVGSF